MVQNAEFQNIESIKSKDKLERIEKTDSSV